MADCIVIARALAAARVNVKGGGQLERAKPGAHEKARRTPNWDKWRLILDPALWQCVALSLNIDPDMVRHNRVTERPDESQEFKDRLDVVNANRDIALESSSNGLRKFAAWAQQIKWSVPPELLAMADNRDTAPVANIFKTMDGLKWSEVVMTFIEPGAVRIKARGKSETFTYEAMGFKDRKSRTAKPNLCWNTLLTLAIVTNTDKALTDKLPPQTDFKRRVSRLRDALQEFFGIKDDPIPYTTTYKPVFVLSVEEHVIVGAHAQMGPDDEDEEDTDALMQQPPGR